VKQDIKTDEALNHVIITMDPCPAGSGLKGICIHRHTAESLVLNSGDLIGLTATGFPYAVISGPSGSDFGFLRDQGNTAVVSSDGKLVLTHKDGIESVSFWVTKCPEDCPIIVDIDNYGPSK
jgi:hypothetical protein